MSNSKSLFKKSKSLLLKSTSDEKFRPIYLDGEKSNYVISNKGYVVSLFLNKKSESLTKLKNNITKNGYNIVCLYHNHKKYWKYIHRLVAEAFIPIPKKYIELGLTMDDLEVNHKDGTLSGKSNNSVENLEWATSSDNKIHAYQNNLKTSGEDFYNAKYSNEQIHNVCKLLEEDKVGMREIWKLTDVSVNTISAILSRKQWKDISKDYNFSNHTKRKIPYPKNVKDEAKFLLLNTNLSYKEIGDKVGMTRNAVWALYKKITN